jgi:hypothetical protein
LHLRSTVSADGALLGVAWYPPVCSEDVNTRYEFVVEAELSSGGGGKVSAAAVEGGCVTHSQTPRPLDILHATLEGLDNGAAYDVRVMTQEVGDADATTSFSFSEPLRGVRPVERPSSNHNLVVQQSTVGLGFLLGFRVLTLKIITTL